MFDVIRWSNSVAAEMAGPQNTMCFGSVEVLRTYLDADDVTSVRMWEAGPHKTTVLGVGEEFTWEISVADNRELIDLFEVYPKETPTEFVEPDRHYVSNWGPQ